MQTKFKKNLLATVIAGMLMPMAAYASEADLLKKIEALAQQNEQLAQQLQALKGQVQANEQKTSKAQAPVLADVASAALTAAGVPTEAGEFETLWASEKIILATHADFVQTKTWKIDGFPMLVLERNGHLDMVTSGYLRMPALVEQLQALVDNSPRD